ncbi:TPA: class I SAM-dependent methyltransferase [Salmonella enterica subsp. enterica]|nr:methyltransferase domain-containing protein [Salmonella enterica]HCZ2200654.1 methyltransferase domain-containing protein [Salmonella enterica subsp. enterica]HCZ2450660.1 methyltransferase domain-containing protein [Salmonella enterica subsp. enterica]
MSTPLDKIKKAYNSPPWWYDIRGFFILIFSYRSSLREQIRFFGINMGNKHLEVAIGSGTLTCLELFWRRINKLPNVEIIGVDYAIPMLNGAIKRFRKNPNVKLYHTDVAKMPFKDNEFNTVNVANAMHCFPDIDMALLEIWRVTQPRGTLAANILLYPSTGSYTLKKLAEFINAWGMRKGILYSPYKKQDIRQRIIQAGWFIEYERVKGNTYNVLARKIK